MFRLLFAVVLGLGLAASTLAQDKEPSELQLPDCDIFLFEFDESGETPTITNGKNITNRPGYDNQPWFTPQSKSILFSTGRSPNRTDIFEYFLDSGETKQFTDTPTQEYSPQISPNNKRLSFVTDGETANQSIWVTNRGSRKEQWLLANQGEREPVGYYSWNHRTGYLLFWSRYGFSLRLVHVEKKLSHYVTGNAPPTTPHIIPGSDKFSFVHRQGNSEVWIKELDPETRTIRPLTPIVGANTNYAWTPKGKVIMAEGDQLHVWSGETGGEWQSFADLDDNGVKGATRVAVSPDGKRLAVVGLPK